MFPVSRHESTGPGNLNARARTPSIRRLSVNPPVSGFAARPSSRITLNDLWRRAVHQHPVHAELRHHIGELIENDRLADITVDTEIVALRYIAVFLRRSHHDDGKG